MKLFFVICVYFVAVMESLAAFNELVNIYFSQLYLKQTVDN